MQNIPQQPLSRRSLLTSPSWQHWDSSGAALAESSSFLVPVYFFPSLYKINRAAEERAERTGGYRDGIQAAE